MSQDRPSLSSSGGRIPSSARSWSIPSTSASVSSLSLRAASDGQSVSGSLRATQARPLSISTSRCRQRQIDGSRAKRAPAPNRPPPWDWRPDRAQTAASERTHGRETPPGLCISPVDKAIRQGTPRKAGSGLGCVDTCRERTVSRVRGASRTEGDSWIAPAEQRRAADQTSRGRRTWRPVSTCCKADRSWWPMDRGASRSRARNTEPTGTGPPSKSWRRKRLSRRSRGTSQRPPRRADAEGGTRGRVGRRAGRRFGESGAPGRHAHGANIASAFAGSC